MSDMGGEIFDMESSRNDNRENQKCLQYLKDLH